MRISSRQLLDASQQAMSKSSVDIANWQTRISSSQRYERASQNPAAAGRAVELATRQSRIDSLKSNQNAAEASMSEIDAQISSMGDAIGVLNEIAVQSQNGALGKAGMSVLWQSAVQTMDLLKSLANADNAGGAPMFADATVKLEIEPQFSLPMNVTRENVFGPGEKGSEEVLLACEAIVQSLAESKAPTLEQMTALKDAATRVMNAQLSTGLVLNQIDSSRNAMLSATDNVSRERSSLLDTDILEGSTELVRSQTQLEAARNVFARLDATGLFKKL